MKRILLAMVAGLALAVGSGTALAQHSGGGHGGGGHGGWHGGHGGWHGGTRIGIGFGFPGFYWGPGWGYGYYGAYPYYAGYPYYYSSYPYYGADPYSYSDEPVYGEPAPGAYIQRDMNRPPQGSQGGAGQYSYYCPDPAGYYPQLQSCPKGWLKVVPENSPRPR
jgi:hypothetical protein